MNRSAYFWLIANAFLTFAGNIIASHFNTQYRTTDDKLVLWKTLALDYVSQNIWHEHLGPQNLLEYEHNGDDRIEKAISNTLSGLTPSGAFIEINPDNFSFLEAKISHIWLNPKMDDSMHTLDNVFIKGHSKIDGYGAYAAKSFRAGELIGEYTGKIKYFPYTDQQTGKVSRHGDQWVNSGGQSPSSDLQCSLANDNFIALLYQAHPYFTLYENPRQSRKCSLLAIDSSIHRNELSFVNNARRTLANAEAFNVLVIKYERSPEGPVRILEARVARVYIAVKNIEPSQEILISYEYIPSVIAERKFLDLRPEYNTCYTCNKTRLPLNKCAACKVAVYCSVACQRSDWPNHKPYCHKSALK